MEREPLKTGDNLKIRFYVDGEEVANYYSKMTSIPVGGMDFVCAEVLKVKTGLHQNGKFNMTATIDDSGK